MGEAGAPREAVSVGLHDGGAKSVTLRFFVRERDRARLKVDAKDGVLSRTIVRELDGVTVLSLQADRLFEPGSAVLDDSAREAIFRLGGTLANLGNRIDVVGHAGPAALEAGEGEGAAGAWDLSLARAIAVTRQLGLAGYTRELAALGQGTGRYRYIAEDIPAARRAALARRVDIRIHAAAGPP